MTYVWSWVEMGGFGVNLIDKMTYVWSRVEMGCFGVHFLIDKMTYV